MKSFIKYSNWKVTLGLLIGALCLSGYFMPLALNQTASALGPLDLLFSYTPEVARAHLEDFGVDGRFRYLLVNLIGDTIYPILYTLFFVSLIAQLSGIASSTPAKVLYGPKWLVFLPLLTLGFDLSENATILFLLTKFPDFQDGVVSLASAFTTLKWCSLALTATVILALLGSRSIPRRNEPRR